MREEAYTGFLCVHPRSSANPQTAHGSGRGRLVANRRLASYSRGADPSRLSDQEAEESTGKYLSYYDRDLVVVDWDAALVIDEPQNLDEVLYLMELANVQFAELEATDRILDDAVERPTATSARRWKASRPRRAARTCARSASTCPPQRRAVQHHRSSSATGTWPHLPGLSSRFHLSDWHRTIDEKLKTLDDLYQLLPAEQNNRWMLILEASIVLLFIVDLVILGMGIKHG